MMYHVIISMRELLSGDIDEDILATADDMLFTCWDIEDVNLRAQIIQDTINERNNTLERMA